MMLRRRSFRWIVLHVALPLFIVLGALQNLPLAIAAADADADSGTASTETCTDTDTNVKPTALLASASRIESLISWIHRNRGAMVDAQCVPYVVPGELYQYLKFDYRTIPLDIEALPDTDYGGDIVLAERILSGKIAKVIYFHDPNSSAFRAQAAQVDLNMILRACDVASVPIALNEASADVGMTAFRAKTKAYLIFNPIAGQRDSNEDLSIIRETLEPFLTLTVVETEKDLDPAVQTQKLVEIIQNDCKDSSSAKCIILASGGDGTVSAVAGATMGSGIPIGIIPRGTANAFSVALGVPTEVRAACRNILRGNVRIVDGAMATSDDVHIPMILLAGIGFEAGMVENAPRSVKDKLGCLAYVIGGVKQFFTQELFKCKLDIDGVKSEAEVAAITVANVAPPTSITAYGTGEVLSDDGLLDITIAVGSEDSGYLDSLYGFSDLLTRAWIQQTTENESILGIRAKSISISCDPDQKVVIDGEMLEMEPIVFTSMPAALHVIAPPA